MLPLVASLFAVVPVHFRKLLSLLAPSPQGSESVSLPSHWFPQFVLLSGATDTVMYYKSPRLDLI